MKNYSGLRKEVNLFDKDFGLSLKNPDNIKLKKMYKKRLIIIYKLILLYTIFVARIPKSKIFRKGKDYELKRVLTEDYLKNHSPLFDEHATIVTEERFKKQFYCMLMIYVINELDSIIKGQIISNSDKISIDENKIVYLTELFSDSVDYLTGTLVFHGDYQTPLLNLYEKLSLKKMSSDKTNKTKLIHYIRTNMESAIAYHDDPGIAMNEIVRLAYSISTNKINYPKKLLIPFDEKPTGTSIKVILRQLGKEMIKDWNKNGRPLFIHIFFNCAPLAYTRYSDINEDIYLNYGVKAIQLVDYMLNDRKIHRIIQHMIL